MALTTAGTKTFRQMEDFDMDNLEGVDMDEAFLEVYSAGTGIDFPEKEVENIIYIFTPPALIVLGVLGNFMSCVILWKMCDKVLSTCLYLLVVAVVDTLVLCLRCGNDWLYHLVNLNIENMAKVSSKSVCKIYPFISDFLLHLSIWLLVAMAMETTLVSCRPSRLVRVFALERARAVVLLMVVLLVCTNAHCFWTYALISNEKAEPKERIMCANAKQGDHSSEEFKRVVWPIIDILVSHLFPYFIIFSCTVIHITKRFKRPDQMRELENAWKTYSLDGMAAKEFQRTILAVCIVYLVLMIPKFACDIFSFLVDPQLKLVKFSVVLSVKNELATAVCSTLHYIFISGKFFIYICTSRKFRHELRMFFTCPRCRSRPRRHAVHSRSPGANCRGVKPIPLTEEEQYLDSNSLSKRPFSITSV